MLTATIRTSNEIIIFEIKNASSKYAGKGKIIIAISANMPIGKATERPNLMASNLISVSLDTCITASHIAIWWIKAIFVPNYIFNSFAWHKNCSVALCF